MRLDDGTRATLLIHFYRAMVARADVWRTRMDATTNWSIGATAAVLSFTLGNETSPHFVVHLGAFLTLIFLFLEARRLTFYHLWQQRVLLLENDLIRPAIESDGQDGSAELSLADLRAQLVPGLGATVPTMSLAKATARRLRRVYVYLFAVQFLAWLMKLASHPTPVQSANEFFARAALGRFPGIATLGLTGFAFAVAVFLALAIGSTHRNDYVR